MTQKTIKISEENYRWLLNVAAEVQKNSGARASFDKAIDELKTKNKGSNSIMDLAGAWEGMTDKEASAVLDKIYKERKISSRRL